ncbi:MAG: hypothetical protein DI586_10430 [Micavibrio aeruginosavorus]|uniref:Uncharacterized protein n=1 Tax=Micavibrio aeruginosavorus TaxID=349221 RepID=A0A2W5FJR0_9BACT|nr:MAG: hypothetical protein DI586_10430 [Micavibrio aeruginosavorus]
MTAYNFLRPDNLRHDLLSHQSDLRQVFARKANQIWEDLESTSLDDPDLRRAMLREYFSLYKWIDDEDQKIDNFLQSLDMH